MTPLAADFLPGLPAGFRYGMDFIWDPSRDGHDQDSAPGETFLTRWGVTQATWDGAVHDGVASGTLEAATQASLGNVFLARYFQAMSLGLFPTAIGFVTWAYALARTSAGRMGAFTYLVPPLAVLLGWALLSETPPALALGGGLLCLFGVAMTRRG